jgi:hypothetical protein
MKLKNGKEIIYPSEGKGDYILKADLITLLKEQIDNPPHLFNDVRPIWKGTLRTILNDLENPQR